MEAWFPINQETKTLESWWPGRGKPLSLVVGDPIPLDDLLDEYEVRRRLPTGCRTGRPCLF